MQFSIKPICDWSIYLTASVDEWLACPKQTSFHCTYGSTSCSCGTKSNYCRLVPYIHHGTTYLTFQLCNWLLCTELLLSFI